MPGVKSLVPSCLLVCVLIPCLQDIVSVFVLLTVVFHHFLLEFVLFVLYPYFVFDCLGCYARAASIVAFAGVIGRGNMWTVEF